VTSTRAYKHDRLHSTRRSDVHGKQLISARAELIMLFIFLCIAECERWRRTENVSAENGVFYPALSVAECMDLCVSKSSCVAINVWSDACSLHMNASDLLSSRATSGVSQFVLDRSCAVSTAPPTSLETVFSSISTTGFM